MASCQPQQLINFPSVGAVREAQARQRAASSNDRPCWFTRAARLGWHYGKLFELCARSRPQNLDYRRQETALSTVLRIIGAVLTVVAISADFLFGGGGIGPPGRVPSNVRISEPVTLRDVPATIVDRIGLTGENRIPGSSLANYWQTENSSAPRSESPVLSELTPVGRENDVWFRSLLDDRYHYIRGRGGAEELYDLQNDPQELNNLAKTEAAGPLLDRFRSLLQTPIPAQN